MIPPRLAHPQTLPADGTILEELISNMQTEYGTPSTPQEYRLIIKIAGGGADANGAAKVAEEPGVAVALTEPGETGEPGRPRRRSRRRGRRRQPGQTEPFPEGVVTDDDDVDETILVEGPDDEEPGPSEP